MNKVLMIAFHYPPCSVSSGIQRTLKFSRYLPKAGWEPIILTAGPKAYPRRDEDQVKDIPAAILVVRAFALDTSRHLSILGFYPPWMAIPDRWVTWWLGAVLAGLRVVRQHRAKVIWSTYPIATAHLIGLTLHRLTGLPWVADFRDSMTEENYPRDVITRRVYLWLERRTVELASRLVFTAESTRQMYLTRYPRLRPDNSLLIRNGYDEEDFEALTASIPPPNTGERLLRIVHSGVVYPDERDPRALFRALARLKKEGHVNRQNIRIAFRAPGFEDHYSVLLKTLGIDDVVHLLPPVGYRQALQECIDADALLLLQAACCNHQIPAKVYEYLRANKPIFALTAQDGDTATLLKHTGGATIVDLSDEEAIYSIMPTFLGLVRDGIHPRPDIKQVQTYARCNQAFDLAQSLFQLLDSR